MTGKSRFVFRCDEYESQRFASRASAERTVAGIVACPHEHPVIEVRWQDGRWEEVR